MHNCLTVLDECANRKNITDRLVLNFKKCPDSHNKMVDISEVSRRAVEMNVMVALFGSISPLPSSLGEGVGVKSITDDGGVGFGIVNDVIST